MGLIVGLTFKENAVLACPHCGKEYKNAAALDKHIKETHPEASSDAPPSGGDQKQD